jgi:hypothetical protein
MFPYAFIDWREYTSKKVRELIIKEMEREAQKECD